MKTLFAGGVLFALFLGAGLVPAAGQTGTSAYPGGPALERAPDFSSWTITCQNTAVAANSSASTATPGSPSASSEPADLDFVTMTVIKTKNLRSVESTDSAGRKSSRFYIGLLESFIAPGTTVPRYLNQADSRNRNSYIDFSQTDFPECRWITVAEYAGVATMSGHQCLVFKDAEAMKSASAGTENGHGSTAYIDVKTRLPVKNTIGAVTYTYVFLNPPGAMLVPPPLMKSRIDFETHRNSMLLARPPAD